MNAMTRSPRTWRPRLNISRRSAPGLALPEVSRRPSLTARPDPRGSLADGILIQGSVRGRVLGIPILKIRTTLVLSPAQIDDRGTPARTRRTPGLPRSSATQVASGRRLADAVKTISQGAEQLANSRRTGE